VLKGAFSFSGLFVQQVVQDVLVALDQTLRVLLSVLQLLVPISLDSLEQSSESQLLRVAQLGLFFLKHSLHFSFQLIAFELLKQIGLHLDFLSLLVALDFHQFSFSVAQVEQIS
jgi:hypothetical protein